jgi:nucleotide-binding universal stress UspA family protein
MDAIKRILVPTDFSHCSNEAIDYAATLAAQLNAEILLVHVMELPVYPVDFTSADPLGFRELKKKADEAMEKAAAPWKGKGVAVETLFLKGDPASEIINAASANECDLIVMGTHGRKGIARVLIGSVTEQVIRSSTIPVLAVRVRREEEGGEGAPQRSQSILKALEGGATP